MAESIGMPEALMEIRNSLFLGTPLTKEFLTRIATAKGINIEVLLRFENQPLRTLYVEGICGGAVLELQKGVTSQRMEVPMNFQSVLAGIMLSAELVAQSGELSAPLPVTTKIDMLKSFGSYLSLPEPKRAGCICQDPDYMQITQRLARLASLNMQRRYIVHATVDEYYLPSELLDDAYDLVRQIRKQPQAISARAVTAILALEPLLDAVLLPPDRDGLQHLVEDDSAWRAVREQAERCLDILGFDLVAWERTETDDHVA